MNYNEAKDVLAEAKAAGVWVKEYIRLGMNDDYYVTILVGSQLLESSDPEVLRDGIKEDQELALQARNDDAFDRRMGV